MINQLLLETELRLTVRPLDILFLSFDGKYRQVCLLPSFSTCLLDLHLSLFLSWNLCAWLSLFVDSGKKERRRWRKWKKSCYVSLMFSMPAVVPWMPSSLIQSLAHHVSFCSIRLFLMTKGEKETETCHSSKCSWLIPCPSHSLFCRFWQNRCWYNFRHKMCPSTEILSDCFKRRRKREKEGNGRERKGERDDLKRHCPPSSLYPFTCLDIRTGLRKQTVKRMLPETRDQSLCRFY